MSESVISKTILEEFQTHASALRKAHSARKEAVVLRNVVQDKQDHETTTVEDTLGRRQPSDVYKGDVNLRTLRLLLKMIDERGWERSDHQLSFHSAFERCVARVLYKTEWATQRPAIMKHNGWETASSEVMISTPRRFGKTFSIAIFCACLALSMGCEIVVFSPARRASRKLLERIVEFIRVVDCEDRICEFNQEACRIESYNGKKSLVRSFPSKVGVCAANTRTQSNTLEPRGKEERPPPMPKRDRDFSPTRLVLPTKEEGEWRFVPDMFAAVSENGHVKMYDKYTDKWTKAYMPRPDAGGYRRVMYNGVLHGVHKLVCLAFHGPNPGGCTPDHLNHNRADNRACNLRWLNSRDQQLNRRKPKPQRNGKPVLLRHKKWDQYTPSLWFASTNIAGKSVGRTGASVRQSIRVGCLVSDYYAFQAEPAEEQSDLEGEEWRDVSNTLRVSSLGRMQTTSNGVWQHKTTAKVQQRGNGYAIVGINKRFHRVVYYAFYPDTDQSLTIDHINRDTSDNRLCNLRAVDFSVQNANRTLPEFIVKRF